MLSKYKIQKVLAALEALYPEAKAELDFKDPFQLLVATVLSAQCTDVRVNQVTKELFPAIPTPADLMVMPVTKLETIIKPCGLYKSKAKNLHEAAKALVEIHDSQIPADIETLMTLPGVGKKTANVVVSNAFGIPAIAVDTHVFRVSNRIGLADATTVEKTEAQLMANLPKTKWSKAHHMIIFHGRRVCKARKPACEVCTISPWCEYFLTLTPKVPKKNARGRKDE
ncbi:MAG: endonuclease [Clostridiales bacterium]|nr:endonuclease [Clostridiales bacterium]